MIPSLWYNDYYKIMTNLNPQQKKAAEKLSGPVLVLAGAGAGKTKTLTSRIINLIESGVAPQNILAITFTNKAAKEMRERILAEIYKNPKLNFPVMDYGFQPFISTFHSLGLYIIKENSQELGLNKHFSIYDRDDTKKTIKEVLKALDLDKDEWSPKSIINFISKNKGNFVDYNLFSKNSDGNHYTETMEKIWGKYEEFKRKDKALDFDDLLLEAVKLLDKKDDLKNHYQRKWQYIHIDEYQDTNKIQYKMAELLTHSEKKNIFAVGDPDQLIYSWRGAELKNIMNFDKDFKGAENILMEQNYRSTKNIIDASNAVIQENKDRFEKKLFTENEEGDKILVYTSFNEREEAEFVAKKIKELIDSKISADEIAVLYRANFQSRILEEKLLKAGIPYQVLGTKFFDRAEIKDLMSYIRLAVNPESQVDLKRVINIPKRGIGKSSVVKIFSGDIDGLPIKARNSFREFQQILESVADFAIQNSPSELVKFVIDILNFEKTAQDLNSEDLLERLANMFELSEFAKKYDQFGPGEGLEKLLDEVALMSDQDSKKNDKENPRVKLMTIHASKGLEFEAVFLTGAEEDLFSPQGIDGDKKKIEEKAEEERRLFYVAMTRAKKSLFISWASMRTTYGQTQQNNISSFVADIPDYLIEEDGTFGGTGTGTGTNFNHEDDFNELDFLDW